MKQHCEKEAKLFVSLSGPPHSHWVACECGMEGSHRLTADDAEKAWDDLVERLK